MKAASIFKIPLAGLLILSVLLINGAGLLAQDDSSGDDERGETPFSETVDGGVVFLNGECLVAPYRIEADADAVRINDQVYHPAQPPSRFGFGGMRWREGRRFGGWPRGRGEDSEESSSSEESSETPREPREEADPDPERRHRFRMMSHTVREARRCVDLLSDDTILVLFDDQRLQEFSYGLPAYELSRGLLGQWNDEVTEETFLSLAEGGEKGRELWRTTLLGNDLPPSVRDILNAKITEYEEVEARNQQEINATHRMDRYSYPLTIIGMLLSVVAFGHVLKWMGGGFQEAGEQASESSRHVVIALVLMFGMSLVDLAWTVLSEQAGLMTEVNPIAARFVDSPYELMAFKLIMTLLGFGILYVWRSRRQMQQATCWLCLICVLLTFRWIVFDSLMMG